MDRKRCCCGLCQRVFCLCFPLGVLVSVLTFRSLICFELAFAYGVKEWSNFIFLHVAVQFSQHRLLKRLRPMNFSQYHTDGGRRSHPPDPHHSVSFFVMCSQLTVNVFFLPRFWWQFLRPGNWTDLILLHSFVYQIILCGFLPGGISDIGHSSRYSNLTSFNSLPAPWHISNEEVIFEGRILFKGRMFVVSTTCSLRGSLEVQGGVKSTVW